MRRIEKFRKIERELYTNNAELKREKIFNERVEMNKVFLEDEIQISNTTNKVQKNVNLFHNDNFEIFLPRIRNNNA